LPNIVKTAGVVLKTMPFKESSLIVSVFTKKSGKVKLLVKGCRRPKSKLCGTMELFNQAEIIYYKKESKDLYTLSDATVIDHYGKIRGDNNKVGAAMVLCEFFDKTLPLEETDVNAYAHLNDYLNKLAESDVSIIKPLALCYLLIVLAGAGFKPHLDNCVRCHTSINYNNKKIDFSISGGGVVCSDDFDDTVVFLNSDTIKLLKDIYNNKNICINAERFREIEKLVPEYLRYHFNQLTLNSLKFLE
jgi:DNA repair protein RecO (recombination protein O)